MLISNIRLSSQACKKCVHSLGPKYDLACVHPLPLDGNGQWTHVNAAMHAIVEHLDTAWKLTACVLVASQLKLGALYKV
jgi:hypothetical protein